MSETGRTALLVVNEDSSRAKLADKAIAVLEAGGITLVRREVENRRQLHELITGMRGKVDLVVLGGGDGTLSGAAIALRDTGLPLGILPLGTANDLARTLGLPPDPSACATIILGGRTRQIDLGLVNGHAFFNAASIGLSCEVTRRLDVGMKRWFGRLAYPFAVLRVVMRARRFGALLRHGADALRVKTLQITVGNGHYYGGGAVVHEDAQIDDHLLHVYSIEATTSWRLLAMVRMLRMGRHGSLRAVRTISTRTLEILTRNPENVSADGELVTVTPARFSLQPASVTVIVP